jgi:hypothetical protein
MTEVSVSAVSAPLAYGWPETVSSGPDPASVVDLRYVRELWFFR